MHKHITHHQGKAFLIDRGMFLNAFFAIIIHRQLLASYKMYSALPSLLDNAPNFVVIKSSLTKILGSSTAINISENGQLLNNINITIFHIFRTLCCVYSSHIYLYIYYSKATSLKSSRAYILHESKSMRGLKFFLRDRHTKVVWQQILQYLQVQ